MFCRLQSSVIQVKEAVTVRLAPPVDLHLVELAKAVVICLQGVTIQTYTFGTYLKVLMQVGKRLIGNIRYHKFT